MTKNKRLHEADPVKSLNFYAPSNSHWTKSQRQDERDDLERVEDENKTYCSNKINAAWLKNDIQVWAMFAEDTFSSDDDRDSALNSLSSGKICKHVNSIRNTWGHVLNKLSKTFKFFFYDLLHSNY